MLGQKKKDTGDILSDYIIYSKNHIKSATFALHAFRWLLTQFSSDCHEIWQALFSSLTATPLKISRKNIM